MGCCQKNPPNNPPGSWRKIGNFLLDLLRFLRNPSILEWERVLHRESICSVCPQRRGKWCSWCGCWLPLKSRVASAECPGGWWPSDPGFLKLTFSPTSFDQADFDMLVDTTWTMGIGPLRMKVSLNADHTIHPGGRMPTTWWHVMGGKIQIYTSTGKLFATLDREGKNWSGRTTRNTPIVMEK